MSGNIQPVMISYVISNRSVLDIYYHLPFCKLLSLNSLDLMEREVFLILLLGYYFFIEGDQFHY